MSKRSLEVTLKILDYFKENPDAKVRHLSLSNEIGEDPTLVKNLLNKYSMFFMYYPEQAVYKINKMGRFKGDVVSMKINADEIVKDKNFLQKFWKPLALSVFVIVYFFFNPFW
jgi:hypothetical protein